MKDDISAAAGDFGISTPAPIKDKPPTPPTPPANGSETVKPEPSGSSSEPKKEEAIPVDTIKRRGFFEAIRNPECPQQQLAVLLKEYEEQAKEKLQAVDELAEKRIHHLKGRIEISNEKIKELQQKVAEAEQYREADDPELQQLIKEKEKQEQELQDLHRRVTEVRIKLGEAKAGIISKSLEEAEMQIRKALDIQKTIYDESWQLNQKKFNDEKNHLDRLREHLSEMYKQYSKRYEKVNKHLAVLDVDGVNPITSHVLTTIGSIAFGAAGFFFSTFAGNAGFGNQDLLSFILGGLVESAGTKISGLAKVGILLGMIALVTAISYLCYFLISRLKKRSEEEILSEMALSAQFAKKIDQQEFQANLKSNTWYGFWLQLIPGILVTGLILILLSKTADRQDILNIHASSEGLIVGASIAMALAGLIYLYIVKIVEPRLLRRYEINPDVPVNWIKGNWELVVILMAFLLFSVCIIAIPYGILDRRVSIPLDQQTRYAILLFIGISLVGSMSFAYSVRSRGLLDTNHFLERVMRWLNVLMAHCTSPRAPELHNKVAEEHGNIIRHVLRQLSFKATINSPQAINKKRKSKDKNILERITEIIKKAVEGDAQPEPQPIKSITAMEPWEQNYFPHIVDELKAVEFDYYEKQKKLKAAEENLNDYREAKRSERVRLESQIEVNRKNIATSENQIEAVALEKRSWRQEVRLTYDKIVTDVLDGFHLGMWYRENGLGPRNNFYDTCPGKPTQLISPQEN